MSLDYFDNVLKRDSLSSTNKLMASMGKAKFYEQCKMYAKGLEYLHEVIVVNNWFTPAVFEKSKLLAVMDEWEQSLEAAQRVLSADSNNIPALLQTVVYLLTRESSDGAATSRMKDLLDSIDRYEPRNPELYYSCASSFARISGRSETILKLSMVFLERANRLNPDESRYVSEMGYHHGLLKDYGQSMNSYREAAKLDETNTQALFGMIYCHVQQGHLEDAANQVRVISWSFFFYHHNHHVYIV
jgi:tetratricopeptide (TPR) repeat protein